MEGSNNKGYMSYESFVLVSTALFGYLYMTNNYENNIKWISQKCLDWLQFKIIIDEEELEKMSSKIIMVTSHTSVYDFILSFLLFQIYFRKRYNCQVLMKKSFEGYVSPIVKYIDNRLKLIQVNGEKNGLVNQVIENLKHQNNYILGMSPEGTRKCVDKLRKGYYYIGKELGCKVIYVGIDYENKIMKLEPEHEICENWEDEEKWFINNCKKYPPLFPEQCFWTKNLINENENNENQNEENENISMIEQLKEESIIEEVNVQNENIKKKVYDEEDVEEYIVDC
jgi:hypothetical protein